jgi:hypothetical protein
MNNTFVYNQPSLFQRLPEIKIVIDTSNSYFSGTSDEIKIIFTKYICTGTYENRNIEIKEFPYILNKNGSDIDRGSQKTYTIKDLKLLDESYVKNFRIEKKPSFIGKVYEGTYTPIPIGVSYSDDWKLKRIRIYYNNKLINDTNPTNSENNSIILDKSNYWFVYPDPNKEIPRPDGTFAGVCGDQQFIKPVMKLKHPFIFKPQGVL